VAAGIPILRTGRWLGELVDGAGYDWFLRSEQLIAHAEVEAILGVAPAVSDAGARVAVLEQQLLEVRGELQQLARLLAAAQHPDPQANASLLPFMEAQQRIEELEKSLAAVALHVPAPPPRLVDEAGVWLAGLRPDIGLLRNSLRVLMGEYQSRAGFLRSIGELPTEGGRPGGLWKSVQGAEKWWERHVPTGRDDTGRAYARYDTDGRQWGVLISWKAEQPADMAWLRRH